jgi:hypothetical protein
MPMSSESTTDAFMSEEWEIVGKAKAKKPKDEPSATVVDRKAAAEAPVAPADLTRQVVSVDSKKLGIIIGPKGATLQALQAATGAEISTPKDRDATGPVDVLVVGPADGVKKGILLRTLIHECCI